MASNTTLVNFGNLQTFKNQFVTFNDGRYLQGSEYVDTLTTKIKADKLPSYVDDVVDVHVVYNAESDTSLFYLDSDGTRGSALVAGEKDKIYIDLDATIDGTYRWSGSRFIPVNNAVSTADRALKDADGNTFSSTYAKLTDLTAATTVTATDSTTGVVKIGTGINFATDGTISLSYASNSDIEELFSNS